MSDKLNQEDQELIERAQAAPATHELLEEVNKRKGIRAEEQDFDAASALRDVECEIQAKLGRLPDKIEVKRLHLDLDPSIDVFQIEVRRKSGVWEETIPTEENLRWFIQGMKAMSPAGILPEFEIPRNRVHVSMKIDSE